MQKGGVMKKIIAIIVILCIGAVPLISAESDCMDNSWHLKKKRDNKELHLVAAGNHACQHNCYSDPTSKIIGDRGFCTGCGHYHYPRPFIIVSQNEEKEHNKNVSQKEKKTCFSQ